MSVKRLQVLFEEEELAEIQRIAESKRQPVAGWVRGVLREAMERESTADSRPKLEALRKAISYDFPAPPIDQMLAEIEAGYGRPDEKP